MKKYQNFILVFAIIIFIWLSVDILNQTCWFGKHIDFVKGSQYGTLIGGIFSFLSVVLIYLTLKQQTISYENSAFENRFFQLIDYHRKNVEAFEYLNPSSKKKDFIKGQKVFINIHREINLALRYLKNDLSVNSIDQILDDKEIKKLNNNSIIKKRGIDVLELEIINLSYLIVFLGLSKDGRPVLERILKQRCDLNKLKTILDFFQNIPAEWDKKDYKQKDYEKRIKKNYHYKYFGGHQHRLGHYFRHIFQTVNYVDKFEPFHGKYEIKYNYLKNFRAQFTTYEQAVFAYNSLSILGRVWEFDKSNEDEHLVTKYNIIKNIPAEFISEFDIKKYYPNVEYEGTIITDEKLELIKIYK